MIKALTELTFVIREWEISKDCGAASLHFIYKHKRAFLATAVAPVSGALHPGHDRLAGHPLAVRRQAKVAHEVDEARGQVQLAAKLTGCIVIRKWMVVVVESFACKRNAQQQSRSREQESKPNQISAPGILRPAVHVITSYPFHKTLMTHQQQAHWAIDSGHCFCLFRDKTCCIPIIYRPQGPRLFTDQTICVHGSHTGPIIQRSQARYNVLPAAHTLGMTSHPAVSQWHWSDRNCYRPKSSSLKWWF